MKNLETERLLLRELLATDLEGMFELDSNPEVHTHVWYEMVNPNNKVE